MNPPRLPALTARAVERALQRAGFSHVRTKGSHRHYKKPGYPNRVTVPQHRGDLRSGTVRAIIKAAGLTVEEFLELL